MQQANLKSNTGQKDLSRCRTSRENARLMTTFEGRLDLTAVLHTVAYSYNSGFEK